MDLGAPPVKSVRLLQIGDVHYPDAVKEVHADIKDAGFPAGLTNLTHTNPMQAVVRRLVDQKVDGVLVCGDLTSKGNIPEYDKCVEYLVDNLAFTNVDRLHAVPGNHDVERSRVDPDGKDLLSKFQASKDAWSSRGFPVLAVDSARTTEFRITASCGVRVFSLNSSLGCGERYFPIEIKDPLTTLLEDYEKKVGPIDAFGILGETLDTPLISKDVLDVVCGEIRKLGTATIPLILTHHNILPQALPRVAVYTELLNGGNIRSRLSHLNRSVVYCHGHIHERPIEVVHEPRYAQSKLVCVSAPELKRGFNIVEIIFSSKNLPIGCRIILYELDMRDGEVSKTEQRVPLQAPNSFIYIGSKKLLSILNVVREGDTRFFEIMDAVKTNDLTMKKREVAEAIDEGEWLGCFEVNNRDQDPDYFLEIT